MLTKYVNPFYIKQIQKHYENLPETLQEFTDQLAVLFDQPIDDVEPNLFVTTVVKHLEAVGLIKPVYYGIHHRSEGGNTWPTAHIAFYAVGSSQYISFDLIYTPHVVIQELFYALFNTFSEVSTIDSIEFKQNENNPTTLPPISVLFAAQIDGLDDMVVGCSATLQYRVLSAMGKVAFDAVDILCYTFLTHPTLKPRNIELLSPAYYPQQSHAVHSLLAFWLRYPPVIVDGEPFIVDYV